MGSTALEVSEGVHKRGRGGPIGTARRASERVATLGTTGVSVTDGNIELRACREIDRVVGRVCQGRAVTVTGWGPRVVPEWGKGGRELWCFQGLEVMGRTGTTWLLVPIDGHAAAPRARVVVVLCAFPM